MLPPGAKSKPRFRPATGGPFRLPTTPLDKNGMQAPARITFSPLQACKNASLHPAHVTSSPSQNNSSSDRACRTPSLRAAFGPPRRVLRIARKRFEPSCAIQSETTLHVRSFDASSTTITSRLFACACGRRLSSCSVMKSSTFHAGTMTVAAMSLLGEACKFTDLRSAS